MNTEEKAFFVALGVSVFNKVIDSNDKVFLKMLANKSFRGLPVSDLVCELQHKKSELSDQIMKFNEAQSRRKLIGIRVIDDEDIYYTTCAIGAILKEITRRTALNKGGIVKTNSEIILAIKEKTKIEDVLEWYCEVFLHKKLWTFRCALHEDAHPSGVIYPEQNSYWCYQCNQGGDVFDAVQNYGRVDFLSSVRKLATNIGLELDTYRTINIVNEGVGGPGGRDRGYGGKGAVVL